MTSPALPDTPAISGRLQNRKARTRASILAAAGELFRTQGFEETSVVQIADAASTGVGTVYGYFASKAEILREVIHEDSLQATERYRAAITSDTPALERITMALHTLTDYIRANRTVLQAAFLASIRDRQVDEQIAIELHDGFSSLLREGINRGQLKPVPIETTARMLVSLHTMAALGVGIWKGGEDEPRTYEELEQTTRAMLSL